MLWRLFRADWPCAFIPETPATTSKIVTMCSIVATCLKEMPTTPPPEGRAGQCAAGGVHTLPLPKIAARARWGTKGKSRYNFFLIALFIA